MFGGAAEPRRCASTVLSFGFKYGLPLDADLVVDVRFLPNPYWIPELRPQTGTDHDGVRDYVLGRPGRSGVRRRLRRAAAAVVAGYQREGKRYLTLAVGCTAASTARSRSPRELAGRG